MELRQYQKDALEAVVLELGEHENALLQAATGCHAAGEKIMLANGRMALVEDVKVGDLLMGPDGKPREVLALHRGTDRMFRIVPLKGAPFVVNGGHVLSLVYIGKDTRTERKGQTVNVSVYEYLRRCRNFQYTHKLYRSPMLPTFGADDAEKPIDPYFLGILLGDGSFIHGVSVTTMDPEVVAEIERQAAEHGCSVRVYDEPDNKSNSYFLTNGWKRNGFFAVGLKKLGLYGLRCEHKFVPDAYKYGSAETRKAILAGLIDTDGYTEPQKKSIEFSTKSPRLAEDVAFIANSLGFRATPAEKIVNGETYYRFCINGDTTGLPLRVPRRIAGKRVINKNVLRTGFSIEALDEGEYYGFTLSGDHLYVMGNFFVMHNSGKTIIFSALVRGYMSRYSGMKVLILAHRKELVAQARDKLLKVWPEGEPLIGVACAGLGPVVLDRPVTIGTPQTLANRLADLPPFLLTIVDEAHHLPPKNAGGQYSEIMDRLREIYPSTRLLGVTATPYRLKHGYIHGDECRAPEENWFSRQCYEIGIAKLQREGYLCKLLVKARECPNLAGVRVMKTGEYNLGDLGAAMSSEAHLGSAVKAVEEHAADRRHIVVFCVGIEHAEKMRKAFRKAGHEAGVVHSLLPDEERRGTLEAFEKGELRVLVNVMVLTEGWDSTAIDCIVLCRPTQAPALYVQMVGRGLRPHEGKENCLLLDLSGNVARFGDPAKPDGIWTPPRESSGSEAAAVGDGGNECPHCHHMNPCTAIWCKSCHKPIKPVVNERRELVPIVFDSFPMKMSVIGDWYYDADYVSKRSGNRMLRIDMTCMDETTGFVCNASAYIDIEGNASSYGWSKARKWWWRLCGTRPPATLEETERRIDELELPDVVEIDRTVGNRGGVFYNVKRWF